jgi:hypothetical protein
MSRFDLETEEHAVEPQRRLELVATLLSEPRLWTEWLAQHPDRSEAFAETFRKVVRLEQVTAWETVVLLRQLGCEKKTTEQLGLMGAEELQRCSDYFGWVEGLVDLVERTPERREVVSRSWHLYRDVRGDLEECQRAMRAGAFSARELLALGEVEKAWLTAQLQIEGSVGDRSRELVQTNPFLELSPHLSRESLDRYLGRKQPRPGVATAERIGEHLSLCDECRLAYESRSDETVKGSPTSVSAA